MDSEWLGVGADAFSAIGTVGAFIVGFVLFRREHRREAGRAEDDRRAQAAKISAWVELIVKADGARELAFHIHNASDMPIYDVELPLPEATTWSSSAWCRRARPFGGRPGGLAA